MLNPNAARYCSWTFDRRPLTALLWWTFMIRMLSNLVVIMKVVGRSVGLLFQPGSVVSVFLKMAAHAELDEAPEQE